MADIPVNASDALVTVDVDTDGQIIFDYDFRADQEEDVLARYDRADGTSVNLVGGTDFTVSGLLDPAGGSIELVTFTATVAGDTLTIYRNTIIDRLTDFQRDLFASGLNIEFDKVYMIMQELRRADGEAIRVPPGDDAPDIDYILEQTALAIAAAAEAVQAAEDAEAAAAGLNLPTIGPGDAGKSLVVKPTEDGYELQFGGSAGGNPFQFFADGDGNDGGTDIGPALSALIASVSASGGGLITIAKTGTGIYRIASTIAMKSNVTVRVEPGVSFDDRSAWPISMVGTAGPEMNTNAHKTRGDTTIATVDPHGLVPGNWVYIVSPRNGLSADAGIWRCGEGTDGSQYAYFAEWLRVAEILSPTFFRSANALIMPGYRTNNTLETESLRERTTIMKITPVESAHWLGGKFLNRNANQLFRSLWAVNCSFEAEVDQGFTAGTVAYWQMSYRCVGKVIIKGDPAAVWDYATLHGKRNHLFTVSCQECGFVGSEDEYAAQAIDHSYGGNNPAPTIGIRNFSIGNTFHRCFEGVTSHPGQYQERWERNKFYDVLRDGISVRGLEPQIINNEFYSSTELQAISDTTSGRYSTGIRLNDGHAKGAIISGNKVSGFRYAFQVDDGADEGRFSNVDAQIVGNNVQNCYGALKTVFSTASPSGALRGIVYQGNTHRNMQRYVVDLGAYSAGVIVSNNTLLGDFLNEEGITSEGCDFLAANAGNCPILTMENNKWLRSSGGNAGVSLRMARVGDVSDVVTYSSVSVTKRSRLRDNFMAYENTAKVAFTQSTLQQLDDFSDRDGTTTAGHYSAAAAGPYTPTLTNVVNAASSALIGATYARYGNIVTVNATLEITATAAGQVQVDLALPVPSALAAAGDLNGVAGSSAGTPGRVSANATDDRARVTVAPANTTLQTYGVNFSYVIK